VTTLDLFPRPTPIPGAIGDWLAIFAGPFVAAIPEANRQAFATEVRETMARRLRRPAGRWTVDYGRLRFAAFKP